MTHVFSKTGGGCRFFRILRLPWAVWLLFGCVSSFSPAWGGVLTQEEQAVYAQAVEDFRFGDFPVAIEKFRSLLRKHPRDARVAEYLGRAYEESGRYEQAVSLYGHWLKNAADQGSPENRFAWIGLANSLGKLKRYQSAVYALAQWRSYAPHDATAAIMQGSMLLRLKQYDASERIWDAMLNDARISSKDQAAAHYYKAFLAYVRGDVAMQKQQAAWSLQKDPRGQYAQPARQFMAAKPARKLGLSVNATLEFGYTSNVELLPDVSKPVAGGSRADVFTQPAVSLLYNFEDFSLGYAFNTGFHSRRSDLDLGYHSLYGVWTHGRWYGMPRLEYMTLGGSFLTYSVGGDLGWRAADLSVLYNIHYNHYSRNLNGSDLRHLGGITHALSAEVQRKFGDVSFALRGGGSLLFAKGDALLYAKSDSYWQGEGGLSAHWSRNRIMLQAALAAYYRKYRQAAPITPGLVRRDSNIDLSGRVSYLLWKRNVYRTHLTLSSGWKKNNSNDASKAYKEWHASAGMQLNW